MNFSHLPSLFIAQVFHVAHFLPRFYVRRLDDQCLPFDTTQRDPIHCHLAAASSAPAALMQTRWFCACSTEERLTLPVRNEDAFLCFSGLRQYLPKTHIVS